MTLTLTTWNINSVRLRIDLVERFLAARRPDILCLQEIKCTIDQFPFEAFRALGYPHIEVHGQKGYHGVATISKLPLSNGHRQDYCSVGDARHLSVFITSGSKTIRLHNFYVPAGGDEPDRSVNPKFGHKLDFVEEMRALKADNGDAVSSILVGDLNIAPYEHDVWSHRQMLKVVSHTPVETEGLLKVMMEGGWLDVMRQHVPHHEKLYTWWSYRAKDWDAADRGRRLDHIWTSPDLGPYLVAVEVLREARGWARPSDHVPVTAVFDL